LVSTDFGNTFLSFVAREKERGIGWRFYLLLCVLLDWFVGVAT
jgi:hypothetical protein